MKQLVSNIERIIDNAGGTWGISLEDLETGESWNWNEHRLFYAASIIKVPILIAAFSAYDNGDISLSESIKLKKEDMVGGAGVLQHMAPGTNIKIYDVLTLMIIQSDNMATNIIIDLIGKEYIQKTMNDIGLQQSKFFNKLMTVPAEIKGYNQITAAEMSMMLREIAKGKVISEHACQQMISIMKRQQLRDCLPAKLPETDSNVMGMIPEWEIVNKTGNIRGIRHDIGIYYVGKRTMIASVLSSYLDDYESKLVFAEIGLEIYNYLKRDLTK